jgi:acyl-CoA thioesterase FadM
VSQGLHGFQKRFATSDATCVMMDRAEHKPVRVPDEVRALFAQHARGGQS